MKTRIFFILLLLSNILNIQSETLTCGEEEIKNCHKCGDDPDLDKCEQCDENHFPLLENLLCFPCDDPIYGQIGCKGTCDARTYSNSGFAFCNECKTGFFNIEGLCYKCSTNSPGCSECTYEKEDGSENKVFKCTKCINDEYRVNSQNYCQKCNMEHCLSCHFTGEGLDSECDQCMSGFYIDAEKTCTECQEDYITGGRCSVCSSDLNDNSKRYCYCYTDYTKKDDYTCAKCPDNCHTCEYDSKTDTTKCLGCNIGFRLNEENTCSPCSEGCAECYLDENKNSVCLRCSSGKLDPNFPDKCLVCPNNCQDCEFDTKNEETICTKCFTKYVLNPNYNKECISCSDSKTALGGCSICDYNPTSESYECKYCEDYGLYAYVTNQYKCLSNTDSTKIGLYGCTSAKFIEDDKYECLSCKSNFIPVITDKSCIEKGTNGLSQQCLEAEKIGDKYSATKCAENYLLIENKDTGLKNCYDRKDDFSYCLDGKIEGGENKCTKCVQNANLNSNKCSCNSDSFSKNTYWCYKCSDNKEGNPGCVDSDGCTYIKANDQLNCHTCKDGYFEYTEGQCFLCSIELSNCDTCHYDNTENHLVCDTCKNGIYAMTDENKCGFNDIAEYPEISPGCIISKDKLEEYLPNRKCETCKYGYFKTKDEKCVYCRNEQYGGPACFECGYEENQEGEETNNIICKKCYTNSFSEYPFTDFDYYGYENGYYNYQPLKMSEHEPLISSEGKCYDCQLEFLHCANCEFAKNEDGNEKLKCAKCDMNYYLTQEGICVNYTGLIEKTPFCEYYDFSISNINLTLSYGYVNFADYNNKPNADFSGFTYNDIKGTIKSVCKTCNYGYILNDQGKCDKLDMKQCSFISIMKGVNNLQKACEQYCYWYSQKVMVYIKFDDQSSKELYINNIDTSYLNYLITQIGDNDIPICLEEGNIPRNLLNCQEAYFFPSNKTYQCKTCYYNYYFDKNNKICKKNGGNDEMDNYYNFDYKDNKLSCNILKNGTDVFPIYYCFSWQINSNQYFTFITNEFGQHEFKKAEGELEGCSEANANTTYINTIYDCTKCYLGYVPYYSKFYKRTICQNMKSSILRSKEINLNSYKDIQEKILVNEYGTCDKDYFFTPDGKNCYKCDVEKGMPGCKGSCDFSLKRNNVIECTGECKSGYIESSEGVCSSCSAINHGCHQCHYELDYPLDYTGLKRKRRFDCDFCEEGYSKSDTGECLNCEDFELYHCNKCEVDPLDDTRHICTQCIDNYFPDSEGECDICEGSEFKHFTKNVCVDCDNTEEGGVPNCHYCVSDGKKVTCNECREGYILLTNNNTCLEIIKNKELQKLEKCEIVTMEQNNKFICSKCYEEFTLINNECKYLPTIYDYLFRSFYQNNYLEERKGNSSILEYLETKDNDYLYQKYNNISSCQEAENKGNEENPLYSCNKCNTKKKKKKNYIPSVKITEENSGVSYCLDGQDKEAINNCTEATYKIKDGKEIFNCTKCTSEHVLTYDEISGTFYCNTGLTIQKCLVLFCKSCNPYDGYICNECITDYEVNSASGSCVKKTEVVPAVTWKDIYRLNMNDEKVINNKVIKGPSLRMKGITSSQINTGHAFIVYLTFKIKSSLRNLEEAESNIIMPAICEIVEGVDATVDDVNIVEYVCIGNSTTEEDMSNYKLDNIEEKKEESKPGETIESEIKASNLNELIETMHTENKFENLEIKTDSEFTYEELNKIVIFKMNEEIDNIRANNYKFSVNIEGELNKELTPVTLNEKFDMAEVEDKANCVFEISAGKKAKLACDLDVTNHKDIKTFSFKTSQVNTENNEIYLTKLNDIVLSNTVEEKKDNNKSAMLAVSLVYLLLILLLD